MLEDDFSYVARKALKGLALSPGEAARIAGLSGHSVIAFTRGTFSAEVAGALAPVLGLSPTALACHPSYEPKPLAGTTVRRLELPFGGESVNAWLVRDDDHALLFDTGFAGDACARALDSLGAPEIDALMITHGHHDHIGGLSAVRPRCKSIRGPAAQINYHLDPIKPGEHIRVGALTVTAIDLDGHCPGALGYVIRGLIQPVCVTGDALFAGSIGGCDGPANYQTALRLIREGVLSLPPRTLLLPGHGPATRVADELARNPFFA